MAKIKIIERRTISANALMEVCIGHGWYTGGTVDEYEHLLYKFGEGRNITTDALVEIAEDIIAHSTEDSMSGYDIKAVMFAVALVCAPEFVKVEEAGK